MKKLIKRILREEIQLVNENIKCYRKNLNPDATLKSWARCACSSGRKCKPAGPDWGPGGKTRGACNCGKPSCDGKTTLNSCVKCCKTEDGRSVRRSDSDRLRRRPYSAQARFRAGLGKSI